MVTILLGLCGLIIGSFLNVIIYRCFLSPKKLDIVNSRSMCPKCQHTLAWYDLIPLFSFILIKGKCRYCHTPISSQYPIVEIITGTTFGLFGYYIVPLIFNYSMPLLHPWSFIVFIVETILGLATISIVIIIAVVDYYLYLIPDVLLFPLTIIYLLIETLLRFIGVYGKPLDLNPLLFNSYWAIKSILSQIMNIEIPVYQTFPVIPSYIVPLCTGLAAALFFFIIVIVTKEKGMGMGDVKLAFFMGICLGWEKTGIALYLAFVLGASVSLILILRKVKTMKQVIPFGPFLISGLLLSLFWSEQIRQLITDIGYKIL